MKTPATLYSTWGGEQPSRRYKLKVVGQQGARSSSPGPSLLTFAELKPSVETSEKATACYGSLKTL